MTKFMLIRHGEADYSFLNNKSFKGHGNDLAFLTTRGINQATKTSKDERLNNSQLILSSPYTRTMHTASIISQELKLPITGEIDLHEWISDLTYKNRSKSFISSNYVKAKWDFSEGIIADKNYESLYKVRERALKVLLRYLDYNKVIVITHGGLIYSLLQKSTYFCSINEVEYDNESIQKMILKR